MSQKNETEENKLIRYVTACVTFFFLFLVGAMVSCSIDSHPGDERIEAEQIKADKEQAIRKIEADKEKTEQVNKLIIDHKIDPVAARCGIFGWDNSSFDREMCLKVSTVNKDMADRLKEMSSILENMSNDIKKRNDEKGGK